MSGSEVTRKTKRFEVGGHVPHGPSAPAVAGDANESGYNKIHVQTNMESIQWLSRK